MNDITLINDAIKKHRELSEYYDAMGCKDDVLVQEWYIGWLSELRDYKEKEKTIGDDEIRLDMCRDISEIYDDFKCSKCGIYLSDLTKVVDEEYDDGYIDDVNYAYEPKFCPECGRKVIYDDGGADNETD